MERKFITPTRKMAQKEKRPKMPLSLRKKCSRGNFNRISARKFLSNTIDTARFKRCVKPEIKLVITPSKQMEAMEAKLREYRNEKTKLEDRITELKSRYGFETMINNELLDVVRENHISVRPGLLRQFK